MFTTIIIAFVTLLQTNMGQFNLTCDGALVDGQPLIAGTDIYVGHHGA